MVATGDARRLVTGSKPEAVCTSKFLRVRVGGVGRSFGSFVEITHADERSRLAYTTTPKQSPTLPSGLMLREPNVCRPPPRLPPHPSSTDGRSRRYTTMAVMSSR